MPFMARLNLNRVYPAIGESGGGPPHSKTLSRFRNAIVSLSALGLVCGFKFPVSSLILKSHQMATNCHLNPVRRTDEGEQMSFESDLVSSFDSFLMTFRVIIGRQPTRRRSSAALPPDVTSMSSMVNFRF